MIPWINILATLFAAVYYILYFILWVLKIAGTWVVRITLEESPQVLNNVLSPMCIFFLYREKRDVIKNDAANRPKFL